MMEVGKASETRAAARAALAQNGAYWRFFGGLLLLGIVSMLVAGFCILIAIGAAISSGLLSGVLASPTSLAAAEDVLQSFLLVAETEPSKIIYVSLAVIAISLIFMYLIGYLTWGKVAMGIATQRGGLTLGHAFSGWGNGWRMSWVVLVKWTYVQLWALLFLVPGIVKFFAYALAEYVAVDRPDWNARQCIDESRRLMKGHCWCLFRLYVSFVPWLLLAIALSYVPVVGRLAGQFLAPYIQASVAAFYEHMLDLADARLANEPPPLPAA